MSVLLLGPHGLNFGGRGGLCGGLRGGVEEKDWGTEESDSTRSRERCVHDVLQEVIQQLQAVVLSHCFLQAPVSDESFVVVRSEAVSEVALVRDDRNDRAETCGETVRREAISGTTPGRVQRGGGGRIGECGCEAAEEESVVNRSQDALSALCCDGLHILDTAVILSGIGVVIGNRCGVGRQGSHDRISEEIELWPSVSSLKFVVKSNVDNIHN